MVTVNSTSSTTTFQKGVAGPASSPFSTTNASYQDVTGMSITSVPNGSKIFYSLTLQKLTSGNLDWRITDGTNVFASGSIGSGGGVTPVTDLTGSITQNSGGAATVKLQILSDDGLAANVLNDTNYTSWICVSDMTGGDPIIVAPTSDSAMTGRPFVFSGKRQIDDLYVFHPSSGASAGDEFSVNVMGYNFDSVENDAVVVSESVSPNVMTNEIRVYPGIEAPIWAGGTSGRSVVIISWTGYNVEVTG